MRAATSFTAVSGWGQALIGVTALLTAGIASTLPQPNAWLALWLGEALLAFTIAIAVTARKLEESDYITCAKSFEGRVPTTKYQLTEIGRRALERYLDRMEALIQAMRKR